jgi:hypothetical protein
MKDSFTGCLRNLPFLLWRVWFVLAIIASIPRPGLARARADDRGLGLHAYRDIYLA